MPIRSGSRRTLTGVAASPGSLYYRVVLRKIKGQIRIIEIAGFHAGEYSKEKSVICILLLGI